MTVVNRFVQAVSHGGLMTKPTLIVIHSAETPLKAGYAKSIAENWFGKSATTSAHFMVDPVEIIRMLSDNVVSYAVGPKANGFTLNIEQAGYARFSRAEWTTADGMAQLSKVAALVRELATTRAIPLRWASDDQIRAAARGVPGGVCFHDDIRRVLGGTTHNDPMPNYPTDLLQQAWGADSALEDDMFDAPDRQVLAEVDRKLTALLGVPGTPMDSRERTPAQQVWEYQLGGAVADLTGSPQAFAPVMAEVFGNSRAILAAVTASDPAAVAAALLPGLQSALSNSSGGIDQAKIEAAFRTVLGSLG